MKCPKCGYLGFESVTRCRNCGYDFSLTRLAAVPELPLRSDTAAIGPLDDLSLIDGGSERTMPLSDATPDLDRSFPSEKARPSSALRDELPLFGSVIPDDEPLITRPSRPRVPLAVRRATPEAQRVRSHDAGAAGDLGSYDAPKAQGLDLPLEEVEASEDRLSLDLIQGERPRVASRPAASVAGAESAPVGQRLVAVAIDVLILAAIDAIVVYFTMQICGLSLEEVGILPKGPLVAFLFVQNGGYLVAFTAGGQTLGKMAAGIRVVPTESTGSLDLGRAFLRTLVWIALAAPAGLGFLTLFGHDHRGLHDRLAGTRVVRASA